MLVGGPGTTTCGGSLHLSERTVGLVNHSQSVSGDIRNLRRHFGRFGQVCDRGLTRCRQGERLQDLKVQEPRTSVLLVGGYLVGDSGQGQTLITDGRAGM